MFLADRHVRIERVVLEHHGDVAVARAHVVDDLAADLDRAVVMSSSPAMVRSSVLLPQPDGPTSTVNSPSGIERSMPRTACTAAVALVQAR